MDSSSTSCDTQHYASTVKADRANPTKLTETKLRLRRVQRTASLDDKIPSLRATLRTTLPVRSLDDIPELSAAVEDFIEEIRENRSESCYSFIDKFSLKVYEAKFCMGYPIINPTYFEDQVKKCRSKNEAVLQRTIMMSVFHHYWLGDKFDWNAEGQWSQPKDTRLPSRQDDSVRSPRPDLALSFKLRSFATGEDDSDPAPEDLQRCISPDGGDRCFPFLFMEVKKAAADLQDAEIANLHNASQALYNIYLWMARANMTKKYFENVRIFSFVFNAQDLSVRVHQACPLSNGNLSFRYDDFLPMSRYTRDQVCLLVNTILRDYAGKELHETLLEAYQEVIAQEDRRVQAKRKAITAQDQVSKRARRSTDSNQHTGQSFGMAQL